MYKVRSREEEVWSKEEGGRSMKYRGFCNSLLVTRILIKIPPLQFFRSGDIQTI